MLVNAHAGLLKVGRPGADKILAAAHEVGLSVEIFPTNSKEEMVALVKQFVNENRATVAVAGGDGTVSCAVQAIAGSNTMLGIIPQGTANNFATALQLPVELNEAIANLKRRRCVDVDLGFVHGDYFTEAAGVGIFADALAIYGRSNKNIAKGMYAIARIFLMLKRSRLTIELENQTIIEKAALCTAANSFRMGRSLTIAPDAKLDDGKLDVVIIGELTFKELLAYYRAFRRHEHADLEKVQSYRSKTVKISSPRVMPVHCDDRIICRTPVEIECRPRILKVIA